MSLTKQVSLQWRMEPDEWRELQALAAKHDRTLSAEVRTALRQWLLVHRAAEDGLSTTIVPKRGKGRG